MLVEAEVTEGIEGEEDRRTYQARPRMRMSDSDSVADIVMVCESLIVLVKEVSFWTCEGNDHAWSSCA